MESSDAWEILILGLMFILAAAVQLVLYLRMIDEAKITEDQTTQHRDSDIREAESSEH